MPDGVVTAVKEGYAFIWSPVVTADLLVDIGRSISLVPGQWITFRDFYKNIISDYEKIGELLPTRVVDGKVQLSTLVRFPDRYNNGCVIGASILGNVGFFDDPRGFNYSVVYNAYVESDPTRYDVKYRVNDVKWHVVTESMTQLDTMGTGRSPASTPPIRHMEGQSRSPMNNLEDEMRECRVSSSSLNNSSTIDGQNDDDWFYGVVDREGMTKQMSFVFTREETILAVPFRGTMDYPRMGQWVRFKKLRDRPSRSRVASYGPRDCSARVNNSAWSVIEPLFPTYIFNNSSGHPRLVLKIPVDIDEDGRSSSDFTGEICGVNVFNERECYIVRDRMGRGEESLWKWCIYKGNPTSLRSLSGPNSNGQDSGENQNNGSYGREEDSEMNQNSGGSDTNLSSLVREIIRVMGNNTVSSTIQKCDPEMWKRMEKLSKQLGY